MWIRGKFTENIWILGREALSILKGQKVHKIHGKGDLDIMLKLTK